MWKAEADPLPQFRKRTAFIVPALGVAQIFAWGGSYYLVAALASPVITDTSWPLAWIVGGLSLGLLVSGGVSPAMGRAVARHGGRSVLAVSSLVLATGLVWIAFAPSLVLYLAGWLVLGLGMGIGLYDTAFATLGQHIGAEARRAITALTLIAGFSSTITWPLSALLIEAYGWRATCLVHAALQLCLCFPIYLFAAPATVRTEPVEASFVEKPVDVSEAVERRAFYLLAATVSLLAAITAIMAVNLIVFLEATGASPARAVALASLMGASQVFGRLIEMFWGRHYHPVVTLIFAAGAVSAGTLLLLFAGSSAALPAIVLYGAGIGVAWVARGTVPMALFGPEAYAVRVGQIARPSLVAQAIAPTIGAFALQLFGIVPTLSLLALLALAAVALAFALSRVAPAD